MNNKILIIGGAGFIGQAICLELQAQTYKYDALDLPDSIFNKQTTKHQQIKKNIFNLDDIEIENIFKNYQTIIYALGPDDRIKVPKNQTAQHFFEQKLSQNTAKITQIAAKAEVKKIIILASYFTYFNQKGIENIAPNTLQKHHPYIKARQLQFDLCAKIEKIEKIFILIPYVFGIIEGKIPIWKTFFIDYFKNMPRVFYGNGGTTVISIDKLAKAVVKSIKYGENNDLLLVGEQNYKFTDLIKIILNSAKVNKKVANIPNWILNILFKLKALIDNNNGLNFCHLNRDILQQNYFVDYNFTDKKLHLEQYKSNMEQVLNQTGEMIRKYL